MGEHGHLDFPEYRKQPREVEKIWFRKESEPIGFIELVEINRPFQFYYIKKLFVRDEHQNKGNGREIVRQLNQFLLGSGKPGILLDSIWHDSPAKGMYERNGWTRLVDNQQFFVFNLADTVSKERVKDSLLEISNSIAEFI